MSRTARSQKNVTEEKTARTETDAERIKREAMARFDERVKRNGNLDGFNKKLDIDLPLFKELYPGMIPRWVKDEGSRVTQMHSIGWSFVPADERIAVGDSVVGRGNTDLGDRISVIGGKDSNRKGGVYRLFLMMIPEEIHTQIVAVKQETNNNKDKEINRLLNGGGEAPVKGAYRPEGEGAKYIP